MSFDLLISTILIDFLQVMKRKWITLALLGVLVFVPLYQLAKALAKLIDHLKKVGAGALFVENISSPALVHQIARETGIKIGGRLFSDALSERGGPATSYEKMFEHNLGTLIAALQKSS